VVWLHAARVTFIRPCKDCGLDEEPRDMMSEVCGRTIYPT
jgi:hypothetical protein